MSFGQAIEAIKAREKVARKGWNGNPDARRNLVPWLASQTDMLSEDWEIV